MVIGVDIFKEFFKDYNDSYLIIGGTACDIIIEEAGFVPRATDDIDMILIIEALTPSFARRFWEFIKTGKYTVIQIEEGKRNCYRFDKPKDKSFPKTIELFSKVPDVIELDQDVHITPIPVGEGLSSLSAILLNDDYYNFTIAHSIYKDHVRFANTEALICMKAFAYLDNKKRKEEGQIVKKRDVSKHKNDVFRLALMLRPDTRFKLPETINKDLIRFFDDIKDSLPDNDILRKMGVLNINNDDIFQRLYNAFVVESTVDIEYEVGKLKKKQKPKKEKMEKTDEIVKMVLSKVYFPMLLFANDKLSTFNELFKDKDWYYFEEPKPPKYGIPLLPVSSDFKGMIDHFKRTAVEDGESHHQFKAMYWLMKYNDQSDFSIEVSFKIWFFDYKYKIDCFIGQPFISSSMIQGMIKMFKAISPDSFDENNPYSTFLKYEIAEKKYDEIVSNEEINAWVNELQKKVFETIKTKANN